MFVILLVLFLLIESNGLKNPQPGDEDVYFYMAKLAAEGKIPYRDFFYAHPPLHLFMTLPVIKLSGFNIVFLKLMPLAAAIITALLVFLIARKIFGDIEAVAALLLFLFSYSTLFNSVFAFGISEAAMFMAFGLYFYYARKDNLLAGIFFGIAGITRLLILIPFFTLILIVFFKNKNEFKKMIAGFFIVFGIINLILVLFFGQNYINPVYKYHLLKSYEQNNINEYTNVIKLNWILFLSAAAVIFVKPKNRILDFGIISAVYLIFLALSSRLFNFYFVPIVPFLAILGGYSFAHLLKKIKSIRLLWLVVIIVSMLFLWDLSANVVFLNDFGFKGFSRGKDIVSFINSEFDSSYDLFGDESTVPLLALMSGRKIAFDIIDTNPAVFKTEILSIEKTLERIKESNIIFVARSKQGISELRQVQDFLNQRCNLMSSFSDKIEGTYFIYECR